MKLTSILFFFLLAFSARAATILNFAGPGYIALNRVWSVTSETGYTDIGFRNTMQSFQDPHTSVEFYADSSQHNWRLMLIGGSTNTLLQVGLYQNATRIGNASPRLDFFGDGRGLGDSIGQFEILELVWGPDNKPSALAVDFQLTSSPNAELGSVRRSLRFNSNIPVG